jgi:hypothetical protein
MRFTVSGGHGRLGSLLVPALRAAGHSVHAPLRSSCDWTCPAQARRALSGADRVLALAAWTDVVGAQRQPAAAVRDTVATTQATLQAARAEGVRVFYVSTDYVLGLMRAQHGVGVYAAAKLVAEQLVLAAGGHVARVAFTTEQQAAGWRWVDGYSLSSRCWADELVPQLVGWCGYDGEQPQLQSLGGEEPCTAEQLLRRRYPEHPALQRVLRTASELQRAGVLLRPPDTSWD